MRSIALLVAATSLISSVAANLYVTKPVATDQCSATLACNVAWQDDNNTPSLASIGVCSIDLCTGGTIQQTCLQNIAGSVDVSKNTSLIFHPDPKIGPTGQFYFLKFTSASLKDPSNAAQPFTAFSAKFTLVGMMGAYNASIENGSVGSVATTPAISLGATTSGIVKTASATSSKATATGTDVISPSNTSVAATATPNGASAVMVTGVVPALAGVTLAAGFASVYLSMLILGL